MEKLAKPSIVKKFLVAMLTIAALSGAVLVTHSSPSAAHGCGGSQATPTTANEMNPGAARHMAPRHQYLDHRDVLFSAAHLAARDQ
jgi:hypothetical protein